MIICPATSSRVSALLQPVSTWAVLQADSIQKGANVSRETNKETVIINSTLKEDKVDRENQCSASYWVAKRSAGIMCARTRVCL